MGKATAKPDKFDFNQGVRQGGFDSTNDFATDEFDRGMWWLDQMQSRFSKWFYIKPQGQAMIKTTGLCEGKKR